jgi:glycosyltransferase involved in cell wall biosynthesis
MVVVQLGPYPPPHGGVQTNLVAIRECLRATGFRAPVINLTRHRSVDADDVYYPRSAFEVVRLLLRLPADIVHLHIGGQLTGRLLALCLFSSLLPGRRVVLTFHSGGYPTWAAARHARPSSVRGFVLRRLDAVIAVNTEIAALFKKLGVEASRIHQICPYAPVSVREDVQLPISLRSFLSAHDPVLTTVGLLEPEYELALQIEAMPEVRRRFPNAGLVIIGSGSLEPDLRRAIAASAARDHVLLCGDVPHEQTIRVIAESDAFLRTTRYDGDSVSVREALQLGTPVIATDNGMRPDGVRLVSRSDVPALCEAVAAALAGPSVSASPPSGPSDLDDVMALYASLAGRRGAVSRPSLPSIP